MDDISGVHEAHAHSPITRRGDDGVLEIGLRGLDHRVVGRDRGLELVDLALLLVDDLLRGDVRLHQGLGAREIFTRRDEHCLVLRLFGLGVVERRLEQARIDQGQHVAFLDMLTLGEQHLLQLAVDLRVDANGQRALHRAEPGQVDRHILPADDGDAHGHACACRRTGRMSSSRALSPMPIGGAADRQHCNAGCDQDDDTATA
jgi:hypothetical protein